MQNNLFEAKFIKENNEFGGKVVVCSISNENYNAKQCRVFRLVSYYPPI